MPMATERYAYTAYGEPSVLNKNGMPVRRSKVRNRYLFQGRRLDEESGLYYFRHRMMSAELGRFLQVVGPIGYRTIGPAIQYGLTVDIRGPGEWYLPMKTVYPLLDRYHIFKIMMCQKRKAKGYLGVAVYEYTVYLKSETREKVLRWEKTSPAAWIPVGGLTKPVKPPPVSWRAKLSTKRLPPVMGNSPPFPMPTVPPPPPTAIPAQGG
ncbi:MAG: hypothetical protein KGZ25_09905 [Planctomycetes bacterium]|nr:hypothetical protein [Planctomycetota bacterium]